MADDLAAHEADDRLSRIFAAKNHRDEQYLIAALLDPDHRAMAAKFLGELGAVEATEPLLRLLDAADPHARSSAAIALGRLGAAEALPRLHEIALRDEEAFVRSWAISALGEIGDPDGVDLLLPLLSDPSWRVRGATARVLGRLGDPRALEPLRSARRKLRRSPLEWYVYRRVYNQAITLCARTSGGINKFGPDRT